MAESSRNTNSRRETILQLIANEDIGTQNDLRDRLEAEGFHVTQATISRDIKEMHLVKSVGPDGTYRYQVAKSHEKYEISHKFYSIYRDSAVSVASALNQVVIHTYTGMAQAICATMDGLDWEGVLGTIAGADTILVICSDKNFATELAKKLREI